MKTSVSKKVIVGTIIILFVGAGVVPSFSGNKTLTENIDVVNEENNVITLRNLDSLNIVTHLATQEEIERLKALQGVYDPTKDYNSNGQGTGLLPPTEEQWAAMVENLQIVDSISMPNTLRGSVDLSSESYFPEVRDQTEDSNSCVAWATAYYANGYMQAKLHGWSDASTGNNDHLLSPSFVYNKIHSGTDTGSQVSMGLDELNTLGVCTWSQMPYDPNYIVSWGDEEDWREAVQYRIEYYNVVSQNYNPPFYDDDDINLMKSVIDTGHPIVFSIDHSDFTGGLGSGDDTLSSSEVSEGHDHAQTIVGYDDTKSADGEVGAFKVVNSWGPDWGTTWGPQRGDTDQNWGGDGFYWITYEAYKQKISGSTYFFDVAYDIDEHPQLLSIINAIVDGKRDSRFSIWLGSLERIMMNWNHNQADDLPFFMCLDVTDFYDEWISGTNDFHLNIGASQKETVRVNDFWMEYYKDEYIPADPFWKTEDALPNPLDKVYGPCDLPLYFTLVYNTDSEEMHPTIQEAIDNANNYDIIEVYPGTYNEHITIDKPLTLISRDREKTIVDGGGVGHVVTVNVDNVNISGFIINNSGTTADSALYITSNNNVISGNTMSYSDYGIWVEGGDNNIILNNYVFETTRGILLRSSQDSVVSGNNVSNNMYGIDIESGSSNTIVSSNEAFLNTNTGIWLYQSDGNVLCGNTLKNNFRGITISGSDNNIISKNIIDGNDYGIRFYSGSTENIVCGNDISNSVNYGLYLDSSTGNIIYHNNFLSNNNQARNSGTNTWSLSYPYGGNHWSNHNTIDQYNGPNQDIWGSDGICDQGLPNGGPDPYTISGGGVDNYPFISPDEWENWNLHRVCNIDSGLSYGSITAAIDAAQTLNGHKLIVDAETYDEYVEIDKRLTLVAGGNVQVYRSTGTVIDVTTDGVKIVGFSLQTDGTMSGSNAIYVTSDSNLIVGNYLRGHMGVFVHSGDDNIICDNIAENCGWEGIFLLYSEYSTVCGNDIRFSVARGIILYKSNYTFIGYNNLIDNGVGVDIYYSNYNILHYNNASLDEHTADNQQVGFYTEDSYNNKFYNNLAANLKWGFYLIWSSNNLLKSNHAYNNGHGIVLQELANENIINDNNVSDNTDCGIYMGSHNIWNVFLGNIANRNDRHGIRLGFDCGFNEFRGNYCNENGLDGFHLSMYGHNYIIGNTASQNENAGINLSSSDGNEIIRNTLKWNTYGIYVDADSNDNIISKNIFVGCQEGVHLDGCSGNSLEENIAFENPYGIYIYGGSYNTVLNCTVWTNDYGIYLDSTEYNDILTNDIQNNELSYQYYGITFDNSNHNTVNYNVIDSESWEYGYDCGIYFSSSSQNTIINNTVANNLNDGICLESNSNNNIFSENNLSNNGVYGARVQFSSGNTFSQNIINECDLGMVLDSSPNSIVIGNTFDLGGINIQGSSQNHWDTHSIDSNFIDGRPIYYIANAAGGSVPPDAAQVILASCTGVTVSDLVIDNVFAGIQMGYCTECDVFSNNIEQCEYGIYLYESDNNNQIYENNIQNSGHGIFLGWSSDNQIFENTIKDNDFGIWDEESPCPNANGFIYNNLFVENMEQAWDSGNYQWYVALPVGGNYWSDYTGVDGDADGFGDTPYVIPPIPRQDLYPIFDNPPNVPSNPYPSNLSFNVDLDISLNWTGGDPDAGDTVTYDVYFGDITPPPQVAWNHPDTSYDPGTLDDDTRYYWKIVARDNYYKTTEGPEWTFTTETTPEYMMFYPTDDAHADQCQPNNNEGHIRWFKVRRGGTGFEVDGLIKFNISSIPPDTTINSAIVHLFYDHSDSDPSGRTINYHRNTEDWDEETVTWNNRPDHDPAISSSAIMPDSEDQWMEWNVTGDVQGFVDGQETNYGWKIIDPSTSGPLPLICFRSKEYTESEYWPYLEIFILVNNPPNTPATPSGPTPVFAGYEHEYNTSTTDPENHQVFYKWDWGDGNVSDWTGSYNSGDIASVQYNWSDPGNYSVKVMAKDDPNNDGDHSDGLTSDWSDPLYVTVSMPGDLDHDGDVDHSDLGIFLADWGCTGNDCVGDIDGDGVTGHSDLGILLSNWGYPYVQTLPSSP